MKSRKKTILIGILFGFVIGSIYSLYAGSFFLNDEQKEEKIKQQEIKKISKTVFSELPTLTFDQLDNKITSGESFIAYFAWVNECGDARSFELNSFDKYLKNDDKIKKMVYVINLDKEAPAALAKEELREDIAKRFQISTWTKDKNLNPMKLKSPQLVHYNKGKIKDLITWSVPNSDDKYGIKLEISDEFFNKIIKNN